MDSQTNCKDFFRTQQISSISLKREILMLEYTLETRMHVSTRLWRVLITEARQLA
jgi:hypothetical protein